MVHRSNDTRLLTSLIKSERDYTTSLNSVLMHSYTSSASLKAYASASSPSMGNIIISIAGLFAAADDALKKYVASVEAWREELKEIKELEDELGVVLRDREILVTRLVKVTKQKPPTAPPPSTGYSRFGGGQPETKLSLAQAELQACEAHLAGMESELEVRRRRALRNGLEARCKALVDCGWVWGEKGKDGLRKLHSIGVENGSNGTVEGKPEYLNLNMACTVDSA
ncbi:hypothetical protein BOTBODRAFT_413835 [Botryobasidium botryosum FD-172 SS1]|uniref:Uncharacterized protein n=1 Tax=Botryobasidium botryosum (strain FD-172 SS1) TaxID=930990 RepID=A0A067MD43_BOTB1|nr:hypothetical protein BOTBODRAFT_413835 [Botryobasidium botryosum FD-172 SS1]